MVKEGYKETEIGVIPEDWNICQLGDVVSFKNGVAHENSITQNGRYIVVNSKFVSTEGNIKRYSNLCLQPCYENDILMVMSDVPNGRAIAKCFYVSENGMYTLNQRICALTTKTSEAKYIYYAINRHPYFLSFDDGVKQTNLTKNNILECKLCIPANDEQQKIAEALSDMDNLISSLEKLIEKKKAIKQGAVQELLTGKKRLPGFNGKWEQQKLNTCTERIIVGLATSVTKHYSAQGTVLFRNLNILPNKLDDSDVLFLDSEFANTYPNKRVRKNDVLTVHTGYVGISCLVPEKYDGALTFTTLITTTKKEILLPEYLMIHLNSELGKKMIELLQAGGGRNNLNVSDFERYEISFPKDTNEQKAIADILFDMDAEITALEQKLAKCQKLKQGMMQQLLTGKIRLISNNDTVVDKSEVDALKVSSKGHNHQFDDAVVIAGIVDKFYSDKYPLGRKKVQKLLYLFRRHQEADTSAFKKKAAGPYADEVRYKGGEPIAISSKYISVNKGTKGSSFSKGEKIADALTYLENWNLNDDIKWLCEQFKYIKTDRLELLATIDMAICDLNDSGEAVTVDSIKNLIKSHPEWKVKLSKSYFKDNDIAWAIKECRRLFG